MLIIKTELEIGEITRVIKLCHIGHQVTRTKNKQTILTTTTESSDLRYFYTSRLNALFQGHILELRIPEPEAQNGPQSLCNWLSNSPTDTSDPGSVPF